MAKSYSDKLKDPRWQKKRLEIMQRDKFMCRECGDTDNTLNVHHLNYIHGMQPWEYDNSDLKTLCELCHQAMHNDYIEIKRIASTFDIETLHYAAEVLKAMKYLYPPDCDDVLILAKELARINHE